MPDFIHFAKDTEDFLSHVEKIDQSWARVIDGVAYVGEEIKGNAFSRIVAINTDDLDKDCYTWHNGKVLRKRK